MLYWTLIILLFVLVSVFPFFHIHGIYYRGLLVIYYKDYIDTGGGFIKIFPDIPTLRIVWWANPFTFKTIDRIYAKDGQHIYANGVRLNVDVATFRKVNAPRIGQVDGESFYLDKESVRWGLRVQVRATGKSEILENFDTDTFEPLGAGYVRDKTGIYYYSTKQATSHLIETGDEIEYHQADINAKVDIADPATFQITSLNRTECAAQDKNFLYRIRAIRYRSGVRSPNDGAIEIIGVLKDEFFEDMGARYYKTSRGIFFSERQILEADHESFENISVEWNKHTYPYAKDKEHVYYMSRIVNGADPETFRIIETSPIYAFDDNNKYCQGRKLLESGEGLVSGELINFQAALTKWKEELANPTPSPLELEHERIRRKKQLRQSAKGWRKARD